LETDLDCLTRAPFRIADRGQGSTAGCQQAPRPLAATGANSGSD